MDNRTANAYRTVCELAVLERRCAAAEAGLRVLGKVRIPVKIRHALLKALKQWNKSERAVLFWRENSICDSSTIVESESDQDDEDLPQSRININGADVTKMFFDYKRGATSMVKSNNFKIEENVSESAACFNILLLNHDQQSNTQTNYLGANILEELKKCSLYDHTFAVKDNLYLAVSKIDYNLQRGVHSLRVGMMKLLELPINEEASVYEKSWIKGIACMLNFLPRKAIDDTQFGESELWSTYFNPVLTSMFSRTEDTILLK